jgi:uncharacterized protein
MAAVYRVGERLATPCAPPKISFPADYLSRQLSRQSLALSMDFEWSAAKRDRTLAERGVDFSAVLAGFLDPKRKIARDLRRDYGEERFNMLANCGGRLYHVTFTMHGAVIRIISARKANQRERRRYEQG